MKNTQPLILTLLLVSLSLGSITRVVRGSCPDCVIDVVPMPGSAAAVNGRRTVVVKISPSFNMANGSMNPTISNAVFGCSGCNPTGSVQQWNDMTDNGQPNGRHIGYFLQGNQATTNPDILIVKVPANSIQRGTADAAASAARTADGKTIAGKRVILVDERALSYPHARLAALIAHEIGHTLGLGDNYKFNCTTIVNTITAQNTPQVQPADVAKVNQHLGDRATCTSEQHHVMPNQGGSSGPTPSPTPTPTPIVCPDNDGDTVCDAQDCNDSNPNGSFDMDGDSFCEDVDCNDINASVHPGAPLDSETTGGEDRNCNGEDDYHELGLGPCGWLAEQMCRNAGKDWDAGHCTCQFFSDPSPIVIDVLGDGFSLTSNANGVSFDLNNDGTKERLSWTKANSDDAWLSLDRNANGTVDGGFELFGNFTPQPDPPTGEERNGFLALAEYDKQANGGNEDGVISRRDQIFSTLRLWQDLNHNGVSELGELFRLDAVGLKKIHLDYKKSRRTDGHGNQFRYKAKVKDAQDAQLGRWAWDVFLVAAP